MPENKLKTELRLPDFMETAFERGDSVTVQNEGTFNTREELLDRFGTDRFAHEVEVTEQPVQDILKPSPAPLPASGKEGH